MWLEVAGHARGTHRKDPKYRVRGGGPRALKSTFGGRNLIVNSGCIYDVGGFGQDVEWLFTFLQTFNTEKIRHKCDIGESGFGST